MRFMAHSNGLKNCIAHVEDEQCLAPDAFQISDGRMAEMIFESTSNPVVATNF